MSIINDVKTDKVPEKTDILDFLAIHAEHQILKYAAGKKMFCQNPKCGTILDYRRIAHIEFNDGGTMTLCSKCFELEQVQAALKEHEKDVKEITKFRKA